VLPLAAVIGTFFAEHVVDIVLLAVAIPLNAIGTVTERWLFFAEAKHTVTLYYGAERA
jgi:DMSO reductase anchor subunit